MAGVALESEVKHGADNQLIGYQPAGGPGCRDSSHGDRLDMVHAEVLWQCLGGTYRERNETSQPVDRARMEAIASTGEWK